MHIDLSGKQAVVSGSTGGIGLAIVEGLAAAGARVVVNGRHADKVEQAIARVREKHPQADLLGFVGDLGSAEGCAALLEKHPHCDILVNNLGVYGPQDFFEIPDAEWTRFFETNVMSGVRLARGYVPGMAERAWGRVVFLSSESAQNIPADMIHYGFSKTALLSISRGLAKRMAGSGVTVNAVLPGPTLSEGVGEMLAEQVEETGKSLEEVGAEFVRTQRPSSIIQRLATVEEVANLVVYTCSTQASATSGAALRVDGGVIDALV